MIKFAPKTYINKMFIVDVFIKVFSISIQIFYLMSTMENHITSANVLHSKIVNDCIGAIFTMKVITAVDGIFQ